MSFLALAPFLKSLLQALPAHPVDEGKLHTLVSSTVNECTGWSSTDNRKSQWEFLLKDEVFRLAESEIDSPSYYDDLWDRLDIILAFSELDVCDQTFPFSVLEDLLETQTIESCSHIFSWIERRSTRLVKGMVPQRGKALVLLRTLNDLLRRLSKTGNTTIFCGRILTFLSAVFPLGERSGVNLRGDYGPPWEDVKYRAHGDEMDVDAGESDGKPLPDSESEKTKKESFYNIFWSMQTAFSRPVTFAQAGTLDSFKESVNTVIPVIKEATVRERAMMGSKSVAGNMKRKRDAVPFTSMEERSQEYFFAKYLTSPELLDLEISDTSFRRQFLFQLLILLTHLSQFTKAEKAKWVSSRNRSLQIDFTLEPDDAKWVQETISKVYEELRQTTPNGRAFAETVHTILDRERNWVRWKNDLCNSFDKDTLSETLEDRASLLLEKSRHPSQNHKHKLGSEALTEIWAMGYRDLHDLESGFSAGDVKDFVKQIERENSRISLRKQQLARQTQKEKAAESKVQSTVSAASLSTPQMVESSQTVSSPSQTTNLVAPSPQRPPPNIPLGAPLHPSLPAKPGTIPVQAVTPKPAVSASSPAPVPALTPVPSILPSLVRPVQTRDPIIIKAEEDKQRLSWLALRSARDRYLHHFGKIGNGDVLALVQEIEKEAEREQRGDSGGPMNVGENGGGAGSDRGTTPAPAPKTGAGEAGCGGISQEQAKTILLSPSPDDATGAVSSDTSRGADLGLHKAEKAFTSGKSEDDMQQDP